MFPRAILLVAAIVFALPARGIVMRADRDDSEYLELASRYASAVSLGAYGEGALIAPRWILTSADVVRAMRETRGTLRMRIGGAEREVQETFASPVKDADIGLVFLREAVADVEPTPIDREGGERGKAVVVVGHGAAARIGAEPVVHDGRKRGAINTIDRVEAATFAMRLKPPDDASDLEGAAGPGDEGAPAFVESQGHLFVAGIAHGPRGAGVPKVGDWDVYARVSAAAAWIDETMFTAAAAEAAASTATPKIRRR